MIDGPLGAQIVESITGAIFDFELHRSRTQPLPTLASHTLLFSAVTLMHRLSRQDFSRAQALLEHLCERHPRTPEPHAWYAKWHVMKVVGGFSSDPAADAAAGRACANRALDERSDHALGLAVDGLVAGFLQGDLNLSQRRYEAAIAANPNEALAWLFMSALHAYRDRGPEAAQAAQTALHLSPLDPIHYYYDSFAAHAMLAAGRLEEAIALARRSLRANGTHMPTHRSLAVALVLSGRSTLRARRSRPCCGPSRRIRWPVSKHDIQAAVRPSLHGARRRCVPPACPPAESTPQTQQQEDAPWLKVDRCPIPVVWPTPATTRTRTPTRTGPTPTPTARPALRPASAASLPTRCSARRSSPRATRC
jgi:tetratricopeptide (TPR) repeat protein